MYIYIYIGILDPTDNSFQLMDISTQIDIDGKWTEILISIRYTMIMVIIVVTVMVIIKINSNRHVYIYIYIYIHMYNA